MSRLPGMLALALAGAAPAAREQPNIVLVFVDDLGWADFSCFGNEDTATPAVDRLAAEGLAFEQFYVNSPICSPSRVAISTGQVPQRWRITSYLARRSLNEERGMAQWLDPAAPMLARRLQEAGYATGHFGKWHMGGQRDVDDAPPITAYGFDVSLTNFEGMGAKLLPLTRKPGDEEPGRIWADAERLGGPVTWTLRSEITGGFVAAALEFIDAAQEEGRPFYLNLWPDDVHSPFWPPVDDWAEDKRARYLAVLRAMDRQLGVLFDRVREDPELRANTLILVCSDNGHEPGAGSAGPLRGCKTNLFEGGLRSPLVVWGPGLVAAAPGTRDRTSVFAAIDLVPSLARLAGAAPLEDVVLDGEDMLDALLGREAASRRSPLFFRRPPDRKRHFGYEDLPDLAVRAGRWKLLCDYDGGRPLLYDLEQDPGELHDRAAERPELVESLKAQVIAWHASLPPDRGSELGAPPELVLHVSPRGDDGAPGTAQAPFATLARAHAASREAGARPVRIVLQAGIHRLGAPLVLGPEDSGTPDAPTVIEGPPDGRAVLRGGPSVTGWTTVTAPEVLARLPEESRSHVLAADLRAQGIDDFGVLRPRGMGRGVQPAPLELFVDGAPLRLAGWPDEGFATIDEPAATGDAFTLAERDRAARWSTATEPWVHGYWRWNWADSYERVVRIDPATGTIETAPPHGVYGYQAGARFRVLNLLEELDRPGEYFLDRASGVLYAWPLEPFEDGGAVVSIAENLVELRGASHVRLRGLTFEAARGTAVTIAGGRDVVVEGCVLRNLGNRAVRIDGGAGHRVVGCHVHHTGDGPIAVAGGDRRTLSPGGHEVTDNHVHHFGRWVRTYTPAIAVQGVGHRVAHNDLHDGPHAAILLGGNEHVIELNEVHRVCLDTDDVGAFYMGRDYTQRGNVVRYNYFHDLGGHGGIGSMAVYLDDFTSGTRVEGNLCVRAGRAVLIGGGRDNVVVNNVFVDCNPAVHVDSRGLGWAAKYFDGSFDVLRERMAAVAATEPPYATRYPELVTLYDDEPAVAKYNRIERNVCVGGRWLDLRDGLTTEVVHVAHNLVGEDPRFVDPGAGDYRLQSDSPALALGFEPLPLERIGPRSEPPR